MMMSNWVNNGLFWSLCMLMMCFYVVSDKICTDCNDMLSSNGGVQGCHKSTCITTCGVESTCDKDTYYSTTGELSVAGIESWIRSSGNYNDAKRKQLAKLLLDIDDGLMKRIGTYRSTDQNIQIALDFIFDEDALDSTATSVSSDYLRSYYLEEQTKKICREGSATYQIEHVWPESFGLRNDIDGRSDLHNLRPAENKINNKKLDKVIGKCDVLSDGCETCKKIGENDYECGDSSIDDDSITFSKNSKIFEPPSDVQGDVARILFYVAWKYNGDCDCTLYEFGDVDDSKARFGIKPDLLEWDKEDPVSDPERYINEKICRFQHNRNPFIDFECLGSYLYGGDTEIEDCIDKVDGTSSTNKFEKLTYESEPLSTSDDNGVPSLTNNTGTSCNSESDILHDWGTVIYIGSGIGFVCTCFFIYMKRRSNKKYAPFDSSGLTKTHFKKDNSWFQCFKRNKIKRYQMGKI